MTTFAKLRTYAGFLRLRAFDVTTETGRNSERYRLAAWAFVTNLASQVMGMLVVVLSIRWTLPYLGAERFGWWMVVVSFSTTLSFLDFGLGNALTNLVARHGSGGSPNADRRAISGGLSLLLALAVAVSGSLFLLAGHLPWERLFSFADSRLESEIRESAQCMALLFGVGLFSSGVQKVFVGLQRGFLGNLVAAIGYALSLLLLAMLTPHRIGVPQLLLATYGVQVLAPLALLPLLRRRKLVALPEAEGMRLAAALLPAQSKIFFLLQIGAIVASATDPLIVAAAGGGVAAAAYAIMQRLFQFVTIPLQLANASLWGAYADAHARGELAFVRRTLRSSLTLTVALAACGSVVLVAASSWLIALWTDGHIHVALSIVMLYALWCIVETTGAAFGVFMNGNGILRPQLVVVAVTTLPTLAAKLLAARHFGLAGLFAVTIGIYLATVAVFYLGIFRTTFRRALGQ